MTLNVLIVRVKYSLGEKGKVHEYEYEYHNVWNANSDQHLKVQPKNSMNVLAHILVDSVTESHKAKALGSHSHCS